MSGFHSLAGTRAYGGPCVSQAPLSAAVAGAHLLAHILLPPDKASSQRVTIYIPVIKQHDLLDSC